MYPKTWTWESNQILSNLSGLWKGKVSYLYHWTKFQKQTSMCGWSPKNRARKTKPPYFHTGWSATEAEYVWGVTKLQQPSSLVVLLDKHVLLQLLLFCAFLTFIMRCSVCEVCNFWPLPLQLPLQCNQVVPDPLNCHWQMRGGGIRQDRMPCTGTVTDCPWNTLKQQ